MTPLDTRTFWHPLREGQDPREAQILKLDAYVSLALHAVHLRFQSTCWQRLFGGVDRVALRSQVAWQYGTETLEAAALQCVATVKPGTGCHLALRRHVALKVPADADGVELRVVLTAVEQDGLDRALRLLDADEFRRPLELAPAALGQAATVTALLKRLFSDAEGSPRLEASWASVIGREPVEDPAGAGRLAAGFLVLVSREEGAETDPERLDSSDLGVEGDLVTLRGRPLPHTYVVYAVTRDRHRGENPRAGWSLKYREALAAVEGLPPGLHPGAAARDAALRLWLEAGALLDADPAYLERERRLLKKAKLLELEKRFREKGGGTAPARKGAARVGALLPAGLRAAVDFAGEPLAAVAREVAEYRRELSPEGGHPR